jgi:hypothetical protein
MDHPQIFKNILLSAVNEGKESENFAIDNSKESDQLFVAQILGEETDDELELFLRDDQKKARRFCRTYESRSCCKPFAAAVIIGLITMFLALYIWMGEDLPEAAKNMTQAIQTHLNL